MDYDKSLCKWHLMLCRLGYICVTMEISIRSKREIWSKLYKDFLSSEYFLQFENIFLKKELLVIAYHISCGEIVTEFCTYRPSLSAGESHLKRDAVLVAEASKTSLTCS